MLKIDPRKRITAAEAMEHPYFDELKGKPKKRGGMKVNITDWESAVTVETDEG